MAIERDQGQAPRMEGDQRIRRACVAWLDAVRRTQTDQSLWPLIEAFRVGASVDNGVLGTEFERMVRAKANRPAAGRCAAGQVHLNARTRVGC
jgi:hypothetical protein